MILNQEAASDAVIAAEQSLHVKETIIDTEVKDVFNILELEFANRVPDITLELVSEYDRLTYCNGNNGFMCTRLADFRAVDAEDIIDALMEDKSLFTLYRMKQADIVKVFIKPQTKASGTVQFHIHFSWQNVKHCFDVRKFIPCLYNQWMHTPDTPQYKRRNCYLLTFFTVCFIIGYSIGLAFAVVDSIQHPVICVEATCEELSSKALDYCGSNYNNSTSSSSTGMF